VNRFTERFRTRGGRRRVRSREVRILEEENFVPKKKRECERKKEDVGPMKRYKKNGATYAGVL
jgi:hypothetical protein